MRYATEWANLIKKYQICNQYRSGGFCRQICNYVQNRGSTISALKILGTRSLGDLSLQQDVQMSTLSSRIRNRRLKPVPKINSVPAFKETRVSSKMYKCLHFCFSTRN